LIGPGVVIDITERARFETTSFLILQLMGLALLAKA